MSTNSQGQKIERPLSPHIQIYKPQITSVMSIFHRITGVGISFALVFFVWFVVSLGVGENSYNCLRDFFSTFIGTPIFFAIILGLYYHLFNGIRHLLWDAGHGYKKECVTKSGITVAILTGIFTFVTVFVIAV